MNLRPRFSLRTLAIVVTLVCAYFGAWEATKRYGIQKQSTAETFYSSNWDTGYTSYASFDTSRCPFIIVRDAYQNGNKQDRVYFLWLFGPTWVPLFESKW